MATQLRPTRSICTSQAQAVELYGLDVPLLAPESLASYQMMMSRPNSSIVASSALSAFASDDAITI